MIPPGYALAGLLGVGAASAVAFASRARGIAAARLARGYLVVVTVLMGARVAAYIAANAFGANIFRPASAGPYDATNVLIGALYGFALVHVLRGGLDAFFRSPDVHTALRVATGAAFVMAGLGGLLYMNATGVDYFVAVGYPKSFHFLIIVLEVLGGAALLIGWPWLTLAVAAGLTIDMFGALVTNARTGAPLDAAAFAMLFRLFPLAMIAARGRWRMLSAAVVGCAIAAFAGSSFLMHRGSGGTVAAAAGDVRLPQEHCHPERASAAPSASKTYGLGISRLEKYGSVKGKSLETHCVSAR